MVVNNSTQIELSIDPLNFRPIFHSYLWNFPNNESLITFLFVHLSVSARNLTYLIVKALTPFKPASRVDVQSLPCGLCCQPNNKADGISPPRT